MISEEDLLTLLLIKEELKFKVTIYASHHIIARWGNGFSGAKSIALQKYQKLNMVRIRTYMSTQVIIICTM